MKFLILLSSFALFFSQQSQATKYSKVCYKIQGMYCNSCRDKIGQKLNTDAAIKIYDISVRDEFGTIQFDSAKTSEKKINQLIKAAGYKGVKIPCPN